MDTANRIRNALLVMGWLVPVGEEQMKVLQAEMAMYKAQSERPNLPKKNCHGLKELKESELLTLTWMAWLAVYIR